jgi:hypothetical protein
MVDPTDPPLPRCDVQDCAEDAAIEVNGSLRLNPDEDPPKWIDVEFNLCAAHEADHDRCHGEAPMAEDSR